MIHSPQSDYAQNQDIESLLERLESLVISARSVPFSDNCMVDREEMLVLITMIRDELPGELKQAKWLLEQNRQLIAEARKEAETIMRDAEARMSRMIDEHEITQKHASRPQTSWKNPTRPPRKSVRARWIMPGNASARSRTSSLPCSPWSSAIRKT
ncbi:MAG: ATPase [Clostridiales bacterium]|nr:ATPase [Clostridiales bacterium]